MSNGTGAVPESRDAGTAGETAPGTGAVRTGPPRRERVVLAAGTVALVAVGARTALGVLRNLPFDPLTVPAWLHGTVVTAAPLATALALAAVAVASERAAVRVGLLFAGVFSLLAALDPAATLPAVAAATAGGIALLGALGRLGTYPAARRSAIALAAVAGVAVSLSSTTGLVDGLRSLGSLLAVVAVAAVGVHAGRDPAALAAGVAAFLAVSLASVADPYVAGSALLVGFAVVGVPHLLVALAAAGATAAAVAGVRREPAALSIGVGLLVFAGVPATVPRATAVLLGVALAVVGPERLVSAPRDSTAGTGGSP